MSKIDFIHRINSELENLDEDQLAAVADFVGAMTANALPRPLTAREAALIRQSKEDFRQGRTLTLDEARARTDAFLRRRREEQNGK